MTDVAVEELHDEILKAWNRGDAEAYVRLFSDDAIVIGFDGSEMCGRDEIAAQLRSIFADHEVVGMVPPGGGEVMPDRNAVQLLSAVRTGGTWRAFAFQNTPAAFDGRPQASQALTEELRAAQG